LAPAAASASFFALAALAKLTAGRTVADIGLGNFGEFGVGGVLVIGGAGGGLLVRSDAVRELVRDIGCDTKRSLVVSRSLSRRSVTSLSRDDTSTGLYVHKRMKELGSITGTYLAAPNGLARELGMAELDAILGEERGLGLAELLVERGISSSLRRVNCGVGGVELLAIMNYEVSACLVAIHSTHGTYSLESLAGIERNSASRSLQQPKEKAFLLVGPYQTGL
jgi:hypothetical protein